MTGPIAPLSILEQCSAIANGSKGKPLFAPELTRHQRAGMGCSPAKARAIAALHEKSFRETSIQYEKFMRGKGWMRGSDLERVMGITRGGGRKFLKKLVSRGLVLVKEQEFSITHFRKPVMLWMWKDSSFLTGTYVGNNEQLYGKRALVEEKSDHLVAQFDETNLFDGARAYGNAWWKFRKEDFMVHHEIGEDNVD